MTAAVYLNFSGAEAWWKLEEYKMLAMKYCEMKGYDLLVLIQLAGEAELTEDIGQAKLLELAENHLVDTIIIPDFYSVSNFLPNALNVIKKICRSGVKVECLEDDYAKRMLCRGQYENAVQVEESCREAFITSILKTIFMSEEK